MFVDFTITADGLPAATAAHMTFALVSDDQGRLYQGEHFPAADPKTLTRSDFHYAEYRQVANEAEFRDKVIQFAKERADIAALGRRELTRHDVRDLVFTGVWGKVDYGKVYAEGVVSVSTPSHGGFILSPERNALVHESLRNGRADSFGCYEEDACWAAVAITFPELFAPHEIAHAERTLVNDEPDAYEAITGRKIPAGASAARRRDEFMAEHSGRLMGVAAVKHPTDPSSVVVTATIDARRDALHRARLFVVDAELYNVEFRNIQFLVDPARDVEVDKDLQPIVARAA